MNPAAIARLPASERNKACLCRRCATSGAAGRFAPVVDRNRCEGKADCVRVCPFGVFEIRKLAPEDRAALSVIGKLKAWAHGGKQSYVANPGSCHACRLCLEACPEDALALRHLP